MKKFISILLSIVLIFSVMITASATDSGDIDFGDIGGVAGDVDVDTYVATSDLVALRKILLSVQEAQSKKTADVNSDEVIDIRDLIRLKRIMSDVETLYYASGITDVAGSSADKTTWMYRVNSSGLYVREADIVMGNGDNVIEFAQLSDFHLMAVTDDEYANDEVLKKTYDARKTAFKNYKENAIRAMEFANMYDKTVITGDVIDFLSVGSLEMLKEVLGNSDAKIAMGNHEFRKKWYDDYEDDPTTLADRYAMTQEYWPNNIHYYSEVIDEKVMYIIMNNGAGSNYEKYYAEEFEYNGTIGTMDAFLAADIATAKEKGYGILIFQHTPINTGDSNDNSVAQLTGSGTPGNYTSFVGSSSEGVDGAVYNLITSNAAVIKGVFNGHMHGHYYTEINAKNSETDTEYNAVIPQYTLTCNAYGEGSALKITVKY